VSKRIFKNPRKNKQSICKEQIGTLKDPHRTHRRILEESWKNLEENLEENLEKDLKRISKENFKRVKKEDLKFWNY